MGVFFSFPSFFPHFLTPNGRNYLNVTISTAPQFYVYQTLIKKQALLEVPFCYLKCLKLKELKCSTSLSLLDHVISLVCSKFTEIELLG